MCSIFIYSKQQASRAHTSYPLPVTEVELVSQAHHAVQLSHVSLVNPSVHFHCQFLQSLPSKAPPTLPTRVLLLLVLLCYPHLRGSVWLVLVVASIFCGVMYFWIGNLHVPLYLNLCSLFLDHSRCWFVLWLE